MANQSTVFNFYEKKIFMFWSSYDSAVSSSQNDLTRLLCKVWGRATKIFANLWLHWMGQNMLECKSDFGEIFTGQLGPSDTKETKRTCSLLVCHPGKWSDLVALPAVLQSLSHLALGVLLLVFWLGHGVCVQAPLVVVASPVHLIFQPVELLTYPGVLILMLFTVGLLLLSRV